MRDPGLRVFCAVLAVLLALAACAAAEEPAPPIQSPFAEMLLLRDARSARASSYDRSGGNQDWIVVPPGETATLAAIEGAGCIKHFYWAYIIDDEAVRRDVLRNHILRMYWDGEQRPSVEAPIGDFFGISNAQVRPLRSLALVVNPGFGAQPSTCGMNCYLPMPFSAGARITLQNDGVHPANIWYHIDYETYPDKPQGLDGLGRLHAQFRRSNPTPIAQLDGINRTGDENYTILEAQGWGNLAGYLLSVDNLTGGWWGEGDDMIFIDGEAWPPSFHGTGSEEIFGGGACPSVEYTGPYTGFHLVTNRDGADWFGKNGMYRFFVQDPIRFRRSIRVSIEHGHANDLANDYSSVAYWYQREPHAPFPPLPARTQREPVTAYAETPAIEGAIEAEEILAGAQHSGRQALALRIPGEWSRGQLVAYFANQVGDFITFPLEVEEGGTCRVKAYLARASDFCILQLKIDGRDQGEPWDGYNAEGGWGPTHVIGPVEADLGTVELVPGRHEFRFEAVGKNDASTGYILAVDAILLQVEPVTE